MIAILRAQSKLALRGVAPPQTPSRAPGIDFFVSYSQKLDVLKI
jgi:hypothetical protein